MGEHRGIRGQPRRQLPHALRGQLCPGLGGPRPDQRQLGQPIGRRRHPQRQDGPCQIGNFIQIVHDRADGQPERHDQHQQQRQRHDHDGQTAAIAGVVLHPQHQWPGGNDQGCRPGYCRQERLHHREAGCDEAADEQHGKRRAGEVLVRWGHGRVFSVPAMPSLRHGRKGDQPCGFGDATGDRRGITGASGYEPSSNRARMRLPSPWYQIAIGTIPRQVMASAYARHTACSSVFLIQIKALPVPGWSDDLAGKGRQPCLLMSVQPLPCFGRRRRAPGPLPANCPPATQRWRDCSNLLLSWKPAPTFWSGRWVAPPFRTRGVPEVDYVTLACPAAVGEPSDITRPVLLLIPPVLAGPRGDTDVPPRSSGRGTPARPALLARGNAAR